VFGDSVRLPQVYDVCHNIAKVESHRVDGRQREVVVHRKGATPAAAGELGVIPGSMAAPGFIVRGRGQPDSIESASHGAGRRMSRTGARKKIGGAELRRQLEAQGIVVRCPSNRGLAEEAPFAYKDVERVVEVVERAGLAGRVVKLAPIGVVKG
jgi:tRNA-splicing ligase RtcB